MHLQMQISSLLPAAYTLHRLRHTGSLPVTPESPSVWNPSEASSLLGGRDVHNISVTTPQEEIDSKVCLCVLYLEFCSNHMQASA